MLERLPVASRVSKTLVGGIDLTGLALAARDSSSSMGGRPPVFVSPIGYIGHQALAADLENFKAALAVVKAEEGFITAVAPGSFARRQNQYYKSDEEFLHALAEALRGRCRSTRSAPVAPSQTSPCASLPTARSIQSHKPARRPGLPPCNGRV
jgi:methionine synthase II (cobalamin-independent)